MPLSKVTFNVNRDGLGRRAPNEDKVSGIVFYNGTPPAGWTTDNIQLVYTLGEAEQKGLTKTSLGHEVEWYHVSEYFRIYPEGELYIGYFPVPASTYDFTELQDMQTYAQGRIRQAGIYANAKVGAPTDVATIQGVIDTIDASGSRMVAIYASNMEAITDWATVGSLRTQTAPKVSVVIGQDGGGYGAELFASKGYSITALGAALGALSSSPVQQSIGYPKNYNVSNGVELEVVALSNGDLISAMSSASLGALKDKGYLVLRKYMPQLAGSYFERQPAAVPATDDFAWIEYSRTMDKAIRLVDTALIPELNRDLLLTSEGKLSGDVVGYFEDLCQAQLDGMEANREISDSDVLIDPDQNVLSTSTLYITIKIIPVGIAEFITVNIGFTVTL